MATFLQCIDSAASSFNRPILAAMLTASASGWTPMDTGGAQDTTAQGTLRASDIPGLSPQVSSVTLVNNAAASPVEPLYQSAVKEIGRQLGSLQAELARLGFVSPPADVVRKATAIAVAAMHHAEEGGMFPEAPAIGADDDETVTLEWFRPGKRLVVYVGPLDIDILRAWGPDIHEDMEERPLRNAAEIVTLLRWLAE